MFGIYKIKDVLLEGTKEEVQFAFNKEIEGGEDMLNLVKVRMLEGNVYRLVHRRGVVYEEYPYGEILEMYQEEAESGKTFIGEII